jgi:cyclophilin family peptidyl-prolyl cis-trans isomerase
VKRNLITAVGAIAIIGGVIVFNAKFNDSMDPTAKADAAETKTEPTNPAMDAYKVKFETTKGDFVVEVTTELSPLGAEQFKEAVNAGVYNDTRFFRVLPSFVVQWGIPSDPKLAAEWKMKTIQDEPVKTPNAVGTITYAKSSMPNSRTTQVFINLNDNSGQLDGMGFAPFGKVVEGMEVVKELNSEWGERPDQDMISKHGNRYLDDKFPGLDSIVKATVIETTAEPAAAEAPPAEG